VLLLDEGLAVRYVNPAGENLLAVSLRIGGRQAVVRACVHLSGDPAGSV
jgi:nitrogen-specific signal transduction histidine kinase